MKPADRTGRMILLAAFAGVLLVPNALGDTAVAVRATSGQPSGLARFDERVDSLLERMTLAEKVGQMTQADLGFIEDPAVIRELALGSVLSGGSSDPPEGNSREAWAGVYRRCQAEALKTRLGIPILYGVDAVHGHSNVDGAVIFPHNIGLGCANDVDLVERISRITAIEVRATGIQWNFAPCVTVPRDDRWGRTYEGFSEDPERVTRLGAAAVRGLQTDDMASPDAVVACAKHFLGDGGTVGEVRQDGFHNSPQMVWDQGDTRCDIDTLRRIHLEPYRACLAEGVATIMPSYSSWNGAKCTSHRMLLTKLLKDELGFDGFLISDYKAVDQCHQDYKTAIGLAINAGIDMAMTPEKYREFTELLIELVEEGTVPMARIDDAVRRILRVKAAAGLLDPSRDHLAKDAETEGFGGAEHRAVAREAVRRSLVLLQNGGALPLDAGAGKIHVAGVAADDLGIQCGGWTIDWQGKAGQSIKGGSSILDGIRDVAGDRVVYSADGAGAAGAAASIVVVGENPYAEGFGDNAELKLSDADRALVGKVTSTGTPTVLVVLSGRPVVLDDELRGSVDAIVAAWLPGSEGDGVADVLFGEHDFEGTLSFSWPRSADQHPLNAGDQQYDPLYPLGYGLSYQAAAGAGHSEAE